ncbi:uncharacterized protein V1516DRAFT_626678 [Lipomyces oligophaga]|uniref:uncharacterized protein n=1 Tax=Lipomyces oligophaga TaxID=45792 RepID=UPI0034CEEC44
MTVLHSTGLPSPNPSIDPCSDDDKPFDKAFQRAAFGSRVCFDPPAFDVSSAINNPLLTPAAEPASFPVVAPPSPAGSAEEEEDLEDHAPAPVLSLLFADTAPRDSWRPQIESWIRRNHSYKLDRAAVFRPYSSISQSRKATTSTSSSSSSISLSAASSSPSKASAPKTPNVDSGLCTPSPSVSPSPKPAAASLHQHSTSHHSGRKCISCGSDQSPCWRPSWSVEAGQLCNSCGLRYKKTGARCLSASCGRIPAKGEWVTMRSTQPAGRYSCLYCGSGVAVGENVKR